MINKERIVKTFLELAVIDSPSLGEREAADYVKKRFKQMGILLEEDHAGGKIGGNAGNLYGFIKGNVPGAPILLSAHLDTVEPSAGKKAVVHEDGTITSDGTTVLGADDMAGVAVIIEAISYIQEQRLPHRDIEVLFTVAEELYCRGASCFDFSKVKSHDAYVLDLSGPVGKAANAAPTILSFCGTIRGKAAHAGFEPEAGIHAIQAVCKAVAGLNMGRIDEETTANVGLIKGGDGTNIIPEICTVKGEIRSLKHEKAMQVLQEFRTEFQQAADEVNAAFEWQEEVHITAYETDEEENAVKDYCRACEKLGITPEIESTFGGSDNNVFAQYGIKGMVLSTAMNQVHSCREYTQTDELVRSAEVVVQLLAVKIKTFRTI